MKRNNKKVLLTLVSLVLILCVTVGGTLAYLFANTVPLKNIFNPTKVTTLVTEEFDGTTKSNVCIKNTGDIDAKIRATVIITFQNEKGEVYGQLPVEGKDYEIDWGTGTDWEEHNDGFYYYLKPVAPDTSTTALIKSITSIGEPPAGYTLCVEILGSGIQADGIPTGSHPWYD